MKQAVFLDRDGVINEVKTSRVKFVNKPEELFFLPKVEESVKAFNDAGFEVFVVTNQGGVGLGFLPEARLKAIHERLEEILSEKGASVREVAYCPHKPKAGCECRKPNPGMLERLAEKHEIDLSTSIMVGDRDDDIRAGRRAGCKTVLVGGREEEAHADADMRFDSLYDAVPWILDQKQ